MVFVFASRGRNTRYIGDWSSDVCSSDLGDFVKRNGNTLAPRTGKRDVNVAVKIDRGICHGMKVVRDLQADVYGVRLAFEIGRASCRERRGKREGDGP